MYLSVEEDEENDIWEGDWLYRVIRDIVRHIMEIQTYLRVTISCGNQHFGISAD